MSMATAQARSEHADNGARPSRYCEAIVAVYALTDTLVDGDFLLWPLNTLALSLRRRVEAAGLTNEAERIAERIRSEKAGSILP